MSNISHNLLTRRSAMTLAAAAFGNALLTPSDASSNAVAATAKGATGGGIPFGAAVHLEPFRNDPMLKKNLIEHVDLIAPMNALKWASLRYDEQKFDFSGADEIIDFAEENGKILHGHALLWYHANPQWLDQLDSPSKLERLLVEHTEAVMGRYAGRIATWDVVNEVVSHNPLGEGKWRAGVWYNALGPKHVDLAFKAAAAVDPNAKLFINDYDLQDEGPRVEARQKAILSIVRRLQDKNIPVHGVGMQAHLYAERRVGRENLGRFVKQLKAMGLTVAITELDIIDWKLRADTKARDRAVANTAQEYLGALTEFAEPEFITTWGLNDRYSWIGETFPREDNAKARPLPFDEDWQAKPLFDVIRSFAQ
ncbi:MAG: endo-1,4-beta-xylanase [Rhizobiaceae bacterium]